MPTLLSIANTEPWFRGEHPSNEKMNVQIGDISSICTANILSLDSYHRLLLQGSSGGVHQATIPFINSSAPTRWTRSITVSTDKLLRVTSGAGTATGGSWTVSGMIVAADGAHNHSVTSHTHTMSHTHTYSHSHNTQGHVHDASHYHITDTTYSIFSGGPSSAVGTSIVVGSLYTLSYHAHTGGLHNHTTSTASFSTSGPSTNLISTEDVVSGTASSSSGATSGTTDNAATHTHTFSYAPSWKPSYLTTIICTKDDDTTLTAVTPSQRWTTREQPTSTKMNQEITNRFNLNISNHQILNTNVSMLLQGTAGGTEQAKLLFALSSAPTGWTRINTHNDKLVRIADGIEAGGLTGGLWTISGYTIDSSGAHTHSLASHVHNIEHGHGAGTSHRHTIIDHTHTLPSHGHNIAAAAASSTGYAPGYFNGTPGAGDISSAASSAHTHAIPAHAHSTSSGSAILPTLGSGTSYTSYDLLNISALGATNSAIASPDLTGSSGSHTHTATHDSSWRPRYLNVIECSKD
jgi:hypothetical protein